MEMRSSRTIALSDKQVPCRVAAPLIVDNIECPVDGVTGMRHANIIVPHIEVLPEVVSFASLKGIVAYGGSLQVLKTANEYTLQKHLHKMMQGVASCCPPLGEQQGVLGAKEAYTYQADRVRLGTTSPSNSPKASRASARAVGDATAAAAGRVGEPEAAALPAADADLGELGSHSVSSVNLRGFFVEAEHLFQTPPSPSPSLRGRIEIVVSCIVQHIEFTEPHLHKITLPSYQVAVARS